MGADDGKTPEEIRQAARDLLAQAARERLADLRQAQKRAEALLRERKQDADK